MNSKPAWPCADPAVICGLHLDTVLSIRYNYTFYRWWAVVVVLMMLLELIMFTQRGQRSVLPFSKVNKIFFGILWPRKVFLDNLNKWFSGWANRYFGSKGSTGSDASETAVVTMFQETQWPTASKKVPWRFTCLCLNLGSDSVTTKQHMTDTLGTVSPIHTLVASSHLKSTANFRVMHLGHATFDVCTAGIVTSKLLWWVWGITSDFGLADLSVRSPRILFSFIGIKLSQNCSNYFWKQNHWGSPPCTWYGTAFFSLTVWMVTGEKARLKA